MFWEEEGVQVMSTNIGGITQVECAPRIRRVSHTEQLNQLMILVSPQLNHPIFSSDFRDMNRPAGGEHRTHVRENQEQAVAIVRVLALKVPSLSIHTFSLALDGEECLHLGSLMVRRLLHTSRQRDGRPERI